MTTTCASHACAGTAPETTRDDDARLRAVALAVVADRPAAAFLPADELAAAAADAAPTLTRA